MDNFRALCSALVDAIDSESPFWEEELTSIADLARAALAQPEPEVRGPSDEELWEMYQRAGTFSPIEFARAAIAADRARWGHHPAPPAEGEVAELVAELRMMASQAAEACQFTDAENLSRAADLLEQLGNYPAIPDSSPQPIPVSERLPEAGDCDAEGRCWWFVSDAEENFAWERLENTELRRGWSHWLPAHALPLPAEERE